MQNNEKEIVQAVCASTNGLKEVEILRKTGDNQYLAKVDGKTCTAIFNWFRCLYYVDDLYGIVSQDAKNG